MKERPLRHRSSTVPSFSLTAAIILLVLSAITLPANAFVNGEAASMVLGQANFTDNHCANSGAAGVCNPTGVSFDSSGNLWAADYYNSRVLEFLAPFSVGELASIVIGQSSFSNTNPGSGQSGLSFPYDIAFDSSGNLWVVDQGNNRVLKFATPLSSSENASLVIGQSSFAGTLAATTQTGLSSPDGLAFDSSGRLWVADGANNRVMGFSPPLFNGEAASIVIGHSGFNQGGGSCGPSGVTSTGLCGPADITFDSSGNLWVSDQTNNRTLMYATPLSPGQFASIAIGQNGLTTSTTCTGPTISCLFSPAGIAFDSSGNLWVSDQGNHRILEYVGPFTTGKSASQVIGQAGFTTGVLNQGGDTSSTGLYSPSDVALDSSHSLWVADTYNNRVLMFYRDLTLNTPTANPPTAHTGQSLTLSANFGGGLGPYTCQWLKEAPGDSSYSNLGSASSCSSPASSSTGPLTTAGGWSFELRVTDSETSPATVTSNPVSVNVNPALDAGAITPLSPAIDQAQSIVLTANPSGGTVPYTYQWYSGASSTCSSDTPISGATSETYAASPAANTYYCYQVTDSASAPASVKSSTNPVTVNPALGAGPISPSAPTIDSGQSITLTANPSGGTSPYSYQWYIGASCTSPISGATSSTYSASPTSTTTYYYKVTDSSQGTPATSGCSVGDTVTVNSALVSGAITPSAPKIDSAQSITLTSSPSGGTTPYSYQWYSGTSATCSSDTTPLDTASTQSVSPTTNTYYCYKVTDSAFSPVSRSSATDLVAVSPALVAGAITPSSPAVDSGQSITLTSHASGGTPSLSYQWYSDGTCTTAIPSSTSSTYSAAPTVTMTYSYKVADSAYSPMSLCSSGDTVTANLALSAGAVTPSSPTIDNGQSITLAANPSGGTLAYRYQWFTGASCNIIISGAASSTLPVSPTSTTTYSYQLTDSSQGTPAASTCSTGDAVSVNPVLVTGAISPSSSTIDAGQSVTLTANPSGGTTPYSYQWYTGSSCNSLISGTSQTNTVSPTITTTYSYKVTDNSSAGARSVCSAGDTVTVNSALAAGDITPSSPVIDSGQSITLTANPLGGTIPYSYQWYSGSNPACSSDTTTLGAAPTQIVSPTSNTYYCYRASDSATLPAAQSSSTDFVTLNPTLVAGATTPPTPTIAPGQTVTLVANPSGGTTPYNYQWYSGGSPTCSSDIAIQGAASSTYATSPATDTYYCYRVTDSSQGTPPAGANSTTNLVTVSPLLFANAISPFDPSVDPGQSITLNANPSGGMPPYSYQWYSGASSTCSSDTTTMGTESTQLVSPSTNAYYCYTVTDSSGTPATANSSTDLVAVNSALAAGAIIPSNPTIDAGQSLVLHANPSGGGIPYSYQWYTGSSCNTAISGATSSTYVASPPSTTTYSYEVSDSSQGTPAASACSAGDTITVNPAFAAGAITPSAPTIDSGQSITLTANPAGGTQPYDYQWYSGTNAACSSDTAILGPAPTQAVSPTTSMYYCYEVTDSAFSPASQFSATNLVTVNPALIAGAITPSVPTIDSGQSITLTAAASGGSAPYSYQWYSASGCPSAGAISGATSLTYSASPTSTTTYSYRVTDISQGSPTEVACSSGDTVTVNSQPVAGAITPSTPSVDTGQSITLTAHQSGGTIPYSYQWFMGSGCATSILGATSSTYTTSPTAMTAYSYRLTDSSQGSPGASSCSPADTVTVNPTLVAGAITPSAPKVDLGQSLALTAHPSGGTNPYAYQWYTNACTTPIPGATSSTYSASPTSTTTYYYKVTDSSSAGATSTCSPGNTVTVNSALTPGSIAPTAPTIDSGQSIVLTANPSGGNTPYFYQWYSGASLTCSSDTSISGAISSTYTASPTSNTYYCYQVTDSANTPVSVKSSTDLVTVNPLLVAGPISPSAPTIDSGQSIILTATPSGGTTPYTYQWYTGASCNTLISGISSTITASSTSTTTYSYKVTDSAFSPTPACSAGNTVTVDPALVAGAITPSAPTIDSGQSIILAASPSGGATPYAYQWHTGAVCASVITGATSSTYSASPTSTTAYSYKVTDSSQGTPAASACSAGDTVTVSSTLVAGAITPSAPVIDSGQSTVLTAAASGGTSPYTFQWYSGTSTACSSDTTALGTASTLTVSPMAQTYYCYKVIDSAHLPASQFSATDLVTVNPALVAGAITPVGPTIASGSSVTLTANPSGGTTPYTYQWYSGASLTCSSDTSISGAISSTYTASPTSNTYYCYQVTDSARTPVGAKSSTDLVTVSSALFANAISPFSPAIDTGQSITLTANPSGGTPPYRYQWYSGASLTCSSDTTKLGTAATLSVSPTTNTYYCYTVTDSSSTPASATSSTDLVAVNPALVAGAVTPTSPIIDAGQSVVVAANPSGGTPSYHYQWYTAAGCTSGTIAGATSSTYTASPSSTTTYYYQVTDSSQGTPTASACSAGDTVAVNAALVVTTPVASSSAIDAGQSSSLSTVFSGGTSPYTCQWLQEPPGAAAYSSLGSSSSCSSPTTTSTGSLAMTGAWSFKLEVSDKTGAQITSGPTTVTINTALTVSVPAALPSTVTQGQSSSLSVTFTGGTSAFTCQWLEEAPGAVSYSSFGNSYSCTSPASTTFSTTTSTAAGTWSYKLQVTDSGSPAESATTNSATVTVNQATLTVTFDATPIDDASDLSGTALVLTVTIGGSGSTCSGGVPTTVQMNALPKAFAASTGDDVCYSFSSPILSTTGGKQYAWSSINTATGSASGLTTQSGSFVVNLSSAVTAAYTSQYQITFADGNLQSDASGPVVAVTTGGSGSTCSGGRTTSIAQGNLPYGTAFLDGGTCVYFAFSSPIPTTTTGKQYAWKSTSGLGQLGQSGEFSVSTGGMIAGTYKTQWQVSIISSPLTGGTITPSGTAYYDNGSSISLTAAASAGYAFSLWSTTTTTGTIILDNTSLLSTAATISGTGMIMAAFSAAATTSVNCTPSSLTVGSTSSCTVTVSGSSGSISGETVTWSRFGGTGAVTFSSPTCGLSGASCSVIVTGTGAGRPVIKASYSGDSTNAGSSATSTLAVGKATPAITTLFSGGAITTGGSGTESPVGQSVTDTAILTGGFSAGGTVTFQYFLGNTCDGTSTQAGDPVTVTSGVVPNSTSQTFNDAGPYSWNAIYSGDLNNNEDTSPCEPLTVTMANPTLAAAVSPSILVLNPGGASAVDVAILSGGYGPTGTLTFKVYGGGACTGTPVFTSAVIVDGNGTFKSGPFTPPAVGTYEWTVAYSGDPNNNQSMEGCGASGETLTVMPAENTLTTTQSGTSTTVSSGSDFLAFIGNPLYLGVIWLVVLAIAVALAVDVLRRQLRHEHS